MTKVTMEYLQANGRYRRATANTEPQWPNFLINHEDKQAHSLMDSPVFPMDKPRRFTSWEEFVTAEPPEARHFPDRLIAVCEDQNIWPVCNNMMPDVQDRQMQFKEFAQDAEQSAVAAATRSAQDSMMGAWSVASLMIFCIVSALILLIALQSDLAKGLTDVVPSVSLPVLLGGLSMRRQKRKQFKEWETVRVFDEMAGFAWSGSLPLKVLIQQLPTDCRYTQELTTARLIAMSFFGAGVYILAALVGMAAGLGLIWGLVLPGLVTPLGIGYGWLKGYSGFMLAPIWVVRRMYKRVGNDQGEFSIDYDSLPDIVPEYHTKLTGMPVEIATHERRLEAEEVIRMNSAGKNGGGTAVATLAKSNLAVAYTPRVWRAYMLYEFLRARDLRSRMKGPGKGADKLQRYSMAGMALGSLGILILALLLLGG